jgi:hypothetical protein
MNRKIHSNEAGYVAERKNPFAAGKVTKKVSEKAHGGESSSRL